MARFFAFFFVSGFCSLVYEIVWMRLAMADFGVNTALVSIFVSSFMAGLGLGCWGAGRWAGNDDRRPSYYLRCYAGAEVLIGLGGVLAPRIMSWQRGLLNAPSSALTWDSPWYFALSGVCVASAVLPWAACMGATIPLGMNAIRRLFPKEAERSFSYLYAANALGAGLGSLSAAFFLVELLGFKGSLNAAALLNAVLALAISVLSLAPVKNLGKISAAQASSPSRSPRGILWLLFLSGAISMAMEIVWTRQFAGYLGNHVYAFAAILWVYLIATFAGAQAYRGWAKNEASAAFLLASLAVLLAGLLPLFAIGSWLPMPGNDFGFSKIGAGEAAGLAFKAAFAAAVLLSARSVGSSLKKDPRRAGPALTALGAAGLCPLVFADPTLALPEQFSNGALRLVLGIGPFCFGAGFVTSWLMDLQGGGRPGDTAQAYAVNMLGCIVGPIAAGFVLLPRLGETWALFALAAPLLALGLLYGGGPAVVGACLGLAIVSKGVSDFQQGSMTRRDATATVSAWGQGLDKMISINGVPGVTLLLPETKMMAHLPLAFLPRRPRSALVLCFGMGTTFRSALSWGIDTTAVELVPSVPAFFGFFHPGADELLALPRARVVIDDGRRFLDRSRETFDVITVDPPPPMQAPGSSLLFSKEFYDSAKKRLAPGGVLQSWCVPNEPLVMAAVAKAITRSFKHVRAFLALKGKGVHFLASDTPLAPLTAAALAERLPPQALRDLSEWDEGRSARQAFQDILAQEMPLGSEAGPLQDDKPVNEYFLLRSLAKRFQGAD